MKLQSHFWGYKKNISESRKYRKPFWRREHKYWYNLHNWVYEVGFCYWFSVFKKHVKDRTAQKPQSTTCDESLDELRSTEINFSECSCKYEIMKRKLRDIWWVKWRWVAHDSTRNVKRRNCSACWKWRQNGCPCPVTSSISFWFVIQDAKNLVWELLQDNSFLPIHFVKKHPNLSMNQPECISVVLSRLW